MNRNTNMHFGHVPQIHTKRSKFDESHSIKTTFNAGDIIPIMVDADILPGATITMDMAELVRMATPIYPIMDNLYLDLYWFFTPNRLLWTNHSKFWGENDDPWTQNGNYEIPQITAPSGGWTEGTIADYMGIPTKVENISINALPFRAYAKIYNDWFRDENLQSCCHLYTDDTTRTGSNGNTRVTDCELGGMPAKAAKFHDYFTAALPQPQKSDPVGIPLTGQLEVFAGDTNHLTIGDEANWIKYGTVGITSKKIEIPAVGTWNGIGAPVYTKDGNYLVPHQYNGIAGNGQTSTGLQNGGHYEKQNITPVNLYADMSSATAVTINQLRTAFAIQKYYENAGLHGTRYIEYLRGVFGVTSSDARMQRAEYLGGQRVPLNIDQIIQTSSTDNTSPQGNTSGFSCTINKASMFTKSFEEHGVLMCLAVVRVDHSYQQGLHKMWTRKKWTDYYNPFFANLGEQAILNENIYAQGSTVVDTDGNVVDKQAFGYQEAWAEYRYKENRVTGYMRSNATGSLDVWHFADDYSQLPKLGSTWIEEPYANVDRTIAVTSQLTHQFIADFYFKCSYTLPMPIYSVPGLIDHV